MERAAALEKRETVRLDYLMPFLVRDFGVMRSRIQAIKHAVLGLTDQQQAELAKAVEDCMSDLSSDDPAAWQRYKESEKLA